MNATARLLAAIACSSLLGLQLSGLHMHVDGHGYSGAPHGTHVHDGDADPHDHEHETDVSIVELGATGTKLLVFLIAVGISIALLFNLTARLAPASEPRPATGRRQRWRPPLRAPPPLSLA
jgi:hypothetical protein